MALQAVANLAFLLNLILISFCADEVDAYQQEWHNKTKGWNSDSSRRGIGGGRRENRQKQQALEYNPESYKSSRHHY